jgi:hypothetical protein
MKRRRELSAPHAGERLSGWNGGAASRPTA